MLPTSFEKRMPVWAGGMYSHRWLPPNMLPASFENRARAWANLINSHRWTRPAVASSLLLLTLFWLTSVGSRPAESFVTVNTFVSDAPNTHTTHNTAESVEFWDLFAYAIAQGEPGFEEVVPIDPKHESWELYHPDEAHKRVDNIQLSHTQYQSLKHGFKAAIKDAKFLAPRMPFNKGTRGIVLTANNDALSVLITSLRMIRKTGSQLPVEIFLDEYEEPACERILPSLGAKCLFVKDQLPADKPNPLATGHFMAKVAALLLSYDVLIPTPVHVADTDVSNSSFEHTLFIDCDMFPVNNPDSIFTTEPFASKGFVLWPDYWADTASHYFYELIDRDIPATDERASTESGAILVNKHTHGEALILAAFFNAWGPKYWYLLLSQNAPGQGDKETWLAAAQALGLPYYTVKERPGHIGYRCDGRPQSVASAQHHPHDDWLIHQYGVRRNSKEVYLSDCPHPRVLFVHGNLPKYDAPAVLHWKIEEMNWVDMQRCKDGQVHRMWGPKEFVVARFGWDVEKALWDSMRWLACEHEFDISMWVNGTWHSDAIRNACQETVEFYEELLQGETYNPELPRSSRPERPWGGYSPYVGRQ